MTTLSNIEDKGQTAEERQKEMDTLSFIILYVHYATESSYRMNFKWLNIKSLRVDTVMFETQLN